MMDWTDRHCRYLHRLYAPHALLYTEMIVSAAIVRGNAARLLAHDRAEHPVALQLGGADPLELAAAALIVHARAAILAGLSPKENREIPPLKYDYVYRLKREHPDLPIVLNGGVAEVGAVSAHVAAGLDGVMLGRGAYHRPALLAELERALVDPAWRVPQP